MKKKQLLATLVMLSLMQGSVYAAPITEEDLTAGETTILDSNIRPIYIIGNTEKEYTVKTDNPDGFKITPEGNGAILVGIEWSQNDNFELSKLTIDNNVTIGSNEDQKITITSEDGSNALIQVGGYSGKNGDAGQLTINGNLNIENIDFSGMQNLISAGGGTDWFGNTGGFSVKDITIDNVDGGDTAGLINLGSNTVTGNVTVTNSTAEYGIDIGNGSNLQDITFENVNLADSAVVGDSFTSGDITFKGKDIDNNAVYGGKYLIDLQNGKNQNITINGDIVIENVKNTYSGKNFISSAIFKNGNGGGHLSVNDIIVNNLEMNANGNDTSAVRIDNGSTFTVNNISVNNINFTSTESINVHAGIYIGSSKTDEKINSLTAKNIKSTASQLSGGEGLFGIDFNNTENFNGVGTITVSDIQGDNLATYGLRATAQDLQADLVDIKKVASKNEIAYGMKLNSGYDSTETGSNIEKVYIEDVSSEKGKAVGGAVTKGSKEQNANINTFEVKNVKSTDNWSLGIWANKSNLNSDYLSVTDVASVNSDAYGLYSQESCNIEADIAYVGDVSSENGVALGLYINGGSIANFKNLQVEQVSSDAKFAAAVNVRNSNLTTDNAVINLPDDEAFYGDYSGFYDGTASSNASKINEIALRSVSGGDINWSNAEDGTYLIYGTIVAGAGAANSTNGGNITINGKNTEIYGDVFAGNGGEVNITLNAGNVLEGQVDDYHELANDGMEDKIFHNSSFYDSNGSTLDVTSAGKATLNINDGGKWIARGKSFVDTISLDGGIIDMSQNDNSSVTVDTLSSKNGVLKMKLNTNDRTQSDMLYVTGSMSGNYQLIIDETNFDASKTEIDPLRFATVKGDVDISGINARSVDVGFFDTDYKIFTEDFVVGDEDNKVYNNSGVEGNDDHAADYKPGNGFAETTFNNDDTNLMIGGIEKQTVSDAGQTIINMSRANYSNAIYMDRLNKRMGEARYINPEDEQGMWVRLRHDRIGKEDAFRSQNTMYEMGYDVKQDCDNGDRRVGFAIDYMDGKTEYRNVAGDGDIKRYGLWMYDTWMGDKGHYADYVLKWGHLENDFDIYNSRGKVNGDYSNNVFSVSAEYGKKNDIGNDWYFEPQAQLQLARVTGADYVTSQNTKVSLDGINSLIGRAGFRLGKDMGERSTVYVKADVLHEFLGDQTISALDTTTNGTYRETFENKGTWYDVGFGFATALGKDSYAFMDFEKSFGNDNDETYQINAGVQWTF